MNGYNDSSGYTDELTNGVHESMNEPMNEPMCGYCSRMSQVWSPCVNQMS